MPQWSTPLPTPTLAIPTPNSHDHDAPYEMGQQNESMTAFKTMLKSVKKLRSIAGFASWKRVRAVSRGHLLYAPRIG